MNFIGTSPGPQPLIYDGLAPTYDSEGNERFYREVARLLKPNGSVVGSALDLGCGCGFSTEEFQRAAPRAEWTAIDSSLPLLSRAGARLGESRVNWVHARAEALPFPAGQFNWVASSLSFHWFGAGTDREVRRVLAPGGRLSISVPLLDPGTRRSGNLALKKWLWSARKRMVRRRSQGLTWDELESRFQGWGILEKKETEYVETFPDSRALYDTLASRGAWSAIFGNMPFEPDQHTEKPLDFSWRIGILHLEVR